MTIEELSDFQKSEIGRKIAEFTYSLMQSGITYNCTRVTVEHMTSYGDLQGARGVRAIEIRIHLPQEEED